MSNYSNLTSVNDIEQHAGQIINEFQQHASHLNIPPLECSFSEEIDPPRRRYGDDNDKSIQVAEQDGVVHLIINSENLLGIPRDALQGWLELKIVLGMVEADGALYQFNFEKQIRPIMQVTGGAMFYIRELVEHLSRALKRCEATKIITRINRGNSQVFYHFYTFNPTTEATELYTTLLAHNWTRANLLCRKLGAYMALSHLNDQGVGFSHTLLKEWRKKGGLTSKDQSFMEDMVNIANQYNDQDFSFRLVEMFKLLKESLLVGRSDVAANDSLD